VVIFEVTNVARVKCMRKLVGWWIQNINEVKWRSVMWRCCWKSKVCKAGASQFSALLPQVSARHTITCSPAPTRPVHLSWPSTAQVTYTSQGASLLLQYMHSPYRPYSHVAFDHSKFGLMDSW